MVKKGRFTLEIINVDTNKSFQEHTASDGLTYAEAEPDTEYFPRFKNDSPNGVVVVGYIDGDSLGYKSYVAAHHTKKLGIWYKKGIVKHETALKFDRLAPRMQPSHDKDSSTTYQFGSIKIKVYATGTKFDPNVTNTTEFTSKWESKIDIDQDDLAKLKRLQSNVGSTILTKDDVYDCPRNWTRGDRIETVEIKYCSTPGLIIKGILPRLPKLEPEDDLEEKFGGSCKRRKLSIEPKIIRQSTQDDDGNILNETTIEMFDLTNDSSDDEADGL